MSNFVRHVGVTANTSSRVIIIFMQIPGAENRTLVVQPDSLPDAYRSTINTLVQSPEGQAVVNFGDFLGRRQFEGLKKDILTVLHEAGRLEPMPIDNILLTPAPNVHYSMRTILEQMGKVVPQPGVTEKPVERLVTAYEQNQLAASSEQRLKMARGFLQQAAAMEADAVAKREEAYKYAPELRPIVSVPLAEAQASAPSETAVSNPYETQLELPLGDTPAVDYTSGDNQYPSYW